MALVSDPRAITATLRRLLDASGLSQSEVCRMLGIKPQSLGLYMTGKRVNPSLAWLVTFAACCGARVVIEMPEGSTVKPLDQPPTQ